MLMLLSGLFASGFLIKTLNAFLISVMCASCCALLILQNFKALIIVSDIINITYSSAVH